MESGGVLCVTAKQSSNTSTSNISVVLSSAGGRGTTECFGRNWTDINQHGAASQFVPQMQLWELPRLYPVFSRLWCQCCMYIITYVLYYSVLYYPIMSLECGANCGFKVSSMCKFPGCILQYYQHISLTQLS